MQRRKAGLGCLELAVKVLPVCQQDLSVPPASVCHPSLGFCLPFLRETLGTKARRGPEAPPSEVSSPPWVEQKSSRTGSLKKLESAKMDT